MNECRALIGGIETQFFVVAARKRRRNLVVVIPGNPGVGHFYIDFARALYAHSDERDDVVICSHAGHCGRATRGGVAYSLEDQVEHKRCLASFVSLTFASPTRDCRLFDAVLRRRSMF